MGDWMEILPQYPVLEVLWSIMGTYPSEGDFLNLEQVQLSLRPNQPAKKVTEMILAPVICKRNDNVSRTLKILGRGEGGFCSFVPLMLEFFRCKFTYNS